MKRFIEKNLYYLKNVIIIFGGNAFVYFIVKLFIKDYNLIGWNIDKNIPFIKSFIYIYLLWYPYLFVSYYFVYKKDLSKFKRLLKSTVMGMLIGNIFYVVYPTMIDRPVVDSFNSLTTFLVYITYKADIPVNCFPSLHCLLSFVIMFYVCFDKCMGKTFRLIVFIISTLIVLSTVFVKQHVLIDVIGAFIIAIIVCVYKNSLKRAT